MFKTTLKPMLCASALLVGVSSSQALYAHTRLQINTLDENTRSYNTVVIGHGCDDGRAVIGTSVIFPDGVDSVLEDITDPQNPKALRQPLSSVVKNWGGLLSVVKTKEIFDYQGIKRDANGKIIGFWAGGGEGLPDGGWLGLVPFRINGVQFDENACAKSVTFVVPIADICQITPASGFSNSTVNLWTPAVGSHFDGPGLDGFNSPATLKINRKSALPASCGAGIDVKVIPSAAQINRDLPIKIGNQQIWPRP